MRLPSRLQVHASEATVLDNLKLRDLNVSEEHVMDAFATRACNSRCIDNREPQFHGKCGIDAAFKRACVDQPYTALLGRAESASGA